MSYNMEMRLHEIPGLTAEQKETLAVKFEPRFETGPPYQADPPTHTVTLAGRQERRAAVSSLLAYNYLHPEGSILTKARLSLAELQMQRPAGSFKTLWPERPEDEAVIAGMHWAAHHSRQVGGVTLAAIARQEQPTERLAVVTSEAVEFIGNEAAFVESLEVAESCVASMEAAGVLAEVDPKRIHGLPLPQPRMAYGSGVPVRGPGHI